MITRVNIKAILGVDFSKTFDAEQVKEALSQAAINVAESAVQLIPFLSESVIVIDKIIQLQAIISQKAIIIIDLQSKIKQAQSTFREVVEIYETGSQKIISIVGATPGASPPYPTAGIELTPLIGAVSLGKTAISNLENQLDEQLTENQSLATQYASSLESLKDKVTKHLQDLDPIQFDPEIEHFIYT